MTRKKCIIFLQILLHNRGFVLLRESFKRLYSYVKGDINELSINQTFFSWVIGFS